LNEKIILFDLDGTIIDIRSKFYNLYVDCLTQHGGTPISNEQYWHLKQVKTSELDILKISSSENVFQSYEKDRMSRIESIQYLQFDEVWTGLESYLHRLKSKYHLSIATLRRDPESLAWQINHLNLNKYFENIIFPPKDSNDAIRYEIKVNMVRNVFGEKELSGWFIGDTEVDILAGKALGLQTCAVGFGLRDLDLMQDLHPDVSVKTVKDLFLFIEKLLSN
jgi:phosphoglycolate phosphatase